MRRRLAAILATDMVGYSQMMAEDELGVIGQLRRLRAEIIGPGIAEFGGRIVKTMGDGLLAEFPSVVDAVDCAVKLQVECAARAPATDDAPITFRTGVHLGDVVPDGDDILGEGVNIAARLEQAAPPGGVWISRAAWEQVRGKIAATAKARGPQRLKNLPNAVEVWEIPPIGGEDAPSPMARIDLLGGFRLTVHGEVLPIRSAKARLLLARLALAPGGAAPREALAAWLWEESSEAQARGSLRQALVDLRKALGPVADALQADAERVTLDPAQFTTDLANLRTAPAGQVLSVVADLQTDGELLAGVSARGRAIEDWLALERERTRTQLLDRLGEAAEAARDAGDAAAALEASRRELALDPLRENAHRRVMELLDQRGDSAGALKQFDALRAALRETIGAEPEAETVELANGIRAGRRRPRAKPMIDATAAAPAPEPEPGLAGAPSLEAELREAVVLCALASDSDPELQEEAGAALRAASLSIAERHGALLAPSEDADALLVFGLNVASEDDAVRAQSAARELAESTPAARFGIASGRLLHEAGDEARITGEARRRAIALASGAEVGEIAIGPEVGLSDPNADSPTGAANLRPKPLFVGRRVERTQIAGLIEAAREDGSGAVVLLSGEAGIGKTRLAEEIMAEVVAGGGLAARDGFSGFGEERVGFARRLAARLAAQGRDDAPAGEPAPMAAARAQLLDLPQPPGGEALLAAMDEARRAETIADVLADMAGGDGRFGLVIVEDAHWANRGELALLHNLANRTAGSGIVLLVTERPGEARFAPLLRQRPLEAELLALNLAPLPARDARRLAAAMGMEDEAFVEQTLRRAGGNALFLVRLLESGPKLAGAPPPTVVSLVQAQTQALPDEDRLTLRRAAILGQRFAPEDFEAIFGPADFRGLQSGGFLTPMEDRIAFGHALLHEAVYTSITRADRRRLHRLAAAHFEGDDAALWADHALLAGDARAAEACAAAADELLPQYQFARGENYIEAGLDSPGCGGDVRAQLLLARGSLARERGDLAQALADYEAATEAAQDDSIRIQTIVRAAWVHRLRGDLELADAGLDAAERLDLGAIPPDLISELWHQRGNQAFARGQVDACAAHHAKAERMAVGPLWRCRALGGLADAQYAAGRMRSAATSFAECVSLAREHGLGIVEMANCFMEPMCRFLAEAGPEAFALIDTAIDRTRQADNSRAILLALTVRLQFGAFALDFDQIEKDLSAIADVRAQLGGTRFDLEVDYIRALIDMARGDVEAARSAATSLWGAMTDADRGYIGPPVAGLAAWAAEDADTARTAIREGEAVLAAGCISHCHFWFRQHAIDAALRFGLWDEAEAQADALAAFTAEEPLDWCDLVIARARLLARIGRHGASAQERAEAAALAEKLSAASLQLLAADLVPAE